MSFNPPTTLEELYALSNAQFPVSEKKLFETEAQRNAREYEQRAASQFRETIYDSLTPEQQDAIYLSYMLNPDSDFYEGYVGDGYTVDQYEHLVRNAPFLRDRFRENYIL